MNTMQSDTSPQRSMAAVCRRREQLQREGVRPERLAWAVAEASESAMALASTPGPTMVRTCLEQARDPRRSGPESEALLVLSAAGVSELRRELRSVGVSLPLTRNEAFREIRQAGRGQLDHELVFRAVRTAGATRILAMVLNHRVPFGRAIADAVVTASRRDGGGEVVRALTAIGAFGARGLHRGVKVDASALVRELGVKEVGELLASESPRRSMRETSWQLEGDEAEALAALSFVQTSSIRRAVGAFTHRSRKRAFQEIKRVRRSGEAVPRTVYSHILTVGPAHVMEVLSSDQSFERTLADEIVAAVEAGDSERADALTGICAFGSWRLRRGVKVDVVDQVRNYGAAAIAEVAGGDSPQRALRRLARAAAGEDADTLAAFSLVDPRRLERSAGRALRQRIAAAMDAAIDVRGNAVAAVGAKAGTNG
jgi:hypothetical protein